MIEERVELYQQYEGKWTALYVPARPPGKPDPSRYDLETKEAAMEYMLSQMCSDCQESRRRALDGTSDPENEDHDYDMEWPACACEWEVLPTQKYAQCESLDDVMDALGAKVIYRRPE